TIPRAATSHCPPGPTPRASGRGSPPSSRSYRASPTSRSRRDRRSPASETQEAAAPFFDRSARPSMLLGFALTEHCNLRCPHCIRDDVTTVRSLDAALVESVLDQALDLYGSVTASFTGGEPL